MFAEARLRVGEPQSVVLQDAVPDGGDHEQLLHAGGLKYNEELDEAHYCGETDHVAGGPQVDEPHVAAL